MRHVMAVDISGSTDGHHWPQTGEDAPDWLGEDTLRHMVAQGQIRIVIAPGVKPEPTVEISKPVAPELRARQRRTKAAQ